MLALHPPFKEIAMPYVDGFVVPVPKAKLDQYKEMSTLCGNVWKEHGALEYREAMADDVKVGKWTSFPQSVDLKDDEIVVFSWIIYESRQHRDAVNEKVMADPRLKDMMTPETMPFDGKRMIFGGFQSFIDL
jgi:uncharacterized protein YbaA (DUF1428 family)